MPFPNPSSTSPNVYIVAAVRTPIGSVKGSLSSLSAVELGEKVVRAALQRVPQLRPADIDEIFMGNVLSANLGQNPARQCALNAGLPPKVISTTVNVVCASGLKAITLAAQTIALGHADVVIGGGMESMSNAPDYITRATTTAADAPSKPVNGLLKDGLTDAYGRREHMGMKAEACARVYRIGRERQDDFTRESYRRAKAAQEEGRFAEEMVEVEVSVVGGPAVRVKHDEQVDKFDEAKMRALLPTFLPGDRGTVTAANSSSLSDGAAALLLMSDRKLKELGVTPLARIVSFADVGIEPSRFTVAPAQAIPLALSRAAPSVEIETIDAFEINEAFAVASIANAQLLGLDADKVNVHGGAVALGHPLGASGARIVATLLGVLRARDGRIGCAAVCNGGGGATALVVERVK